MTRSKKIVTPATPAPPIADILSLTERLYEIGKRKIASGQDVGQENMQLLNRARKQIAARRS